MKRFGVIMAGGGGTRFWPVSRQKTPKQLLNLSGEDALINETINRICKLVGKEDIFIVTNESQGELMRRTIDCSGGISDKILYEPSARNTAAAVGYAAFAIKKRYGDGIMCVFPSDHYIKNEELFCETMEKAIEIASKDDKLVTVGIRPTFPSTGYGYIRLDATSSVRYKEEAFDVAEFVEKPDIETAKSFLDSGEYVWNSGMFVWKASRILEEFQRFLPKVYDRLLEIYEAMRTDEELEVLRMVYPEITSISIDYGIMERSSDVVVVPGDFGWNDVGSWDSLGAIFRTDERGNIIRGENISIDTSNSVIYGNGRLIAAIGLENMIVVETEDSVLVCHKDKAQDVKKVVEFLQKNGRYDLL